VASTDKYNEQSRFDEFNGSTLQRKKERNKQRKKERKKERRNKRKHSHTAESLSLTK